MSAIKGISSVLTIILYLVLVSIFATNTVNSLKAANLESVHGNGCFRAAVYEHIYQGNVSEAPANLINKNLRVYEEIISNASKFGVNILVFPENGIIIPVYKRDELANIAENIPDPKGGEYNPCEMSDKYKSKPMTLRLSCLAKTYNMYIVADYTNREDCSNTTDPKCPEDGYYLFNTAVAFNANGSVVARYHKMNLFQEPNVNAAPKKELIYFDTPFGRIGLSICADILYKYPGTQLVEEYGVQTMIWPFHWEDNLPFNSVKQLQEGWSVTNRVNLLASNQKLFKIGMTGSGIYSGSNGPFIYTGIDTTSAELLIADIPIDSRNTSAQCLTNRFSKSISITHLSDESEYKEGFDLSLKGSTLFRLNVKTFSINITNNGLNCKLKYEVESESPLKEEWYYLYAENASALKQDPYPMCTEICGVIRCEDKDCTKYSTNKSKTIFKTLELSAQFSTNYTYPSLTSSDLRLIPKNNWIYESNGKIGSEVKLTLNGFNETVLTMGIYSRCFDRDLQ